MQKITLILDTAWQFKEFPESARRMRDLDAGDWLDTTVPASIFTCLQQAGVISDLSSGSDDIQWVDHKSWVFRKEFDVSPELLEKERIQIIFDGLDTIAHIWLNEKLIGKTDNMFISHRFDIKPYLTESRNRLHIKFMSALNHTDRLLSRYGELSMYPLRDPRSAYIRKAAYQFNSSHGPALAGCGIFRGVRIEGSNVATIENLHLRTIDCNQHTADIRVALELNRTENNSAPLTCKVTVRGGGLNLEHELPFGNNDKTLSTILHIERPFLWWPHGYGVPHLYHVKVDLLTMEGQLLDTIAEDFGVRTIHIEKTSAGTKCIVNGQTIAIKGADWLPPSLYPGTKTDYQPLLNRAKSCHINLLRIRADGYYENDELYHLCNAMGILVWQDFMFDSAFYPDRQWFTDNVKNEAETIIKRLRNHACIGLWCGNNNIDYLHKIGKLGKGRKFYGKPIFYKLLPGLICELDPDREYIPTFSNANWEEQALVHRTPVIPSPPCRTSLSTQADDAESFGILEKLADSPATLGKIAQHQTDEFHPPRNLSEYIWQSQVAQARRVQTSVEHIRCSADSGNCMLGPLNTDALSIDPAMLDAQRQPKALFYYAQRVFAPILVTLLPNEKTGILKAFVVNDTASPITGVLRCRMITISGEIEDATEMPVRVSPFSRATEINLPKSLSMPSDPTQTFISICIINNGMILANNTHFYCSDKYFKWPAADIDLQVSPSEKAWDITLISKAPVRDLQITPPQPADINDNFLTLLPNEPKEIRISYYNSPPSVRTPLDMISTHQAYTSD